jgi:alkylation response protein AidB-like acyl-CoA dehydrogenase
MPGTPLDRILHQIRAFVRDELLPLEDGLRAGGFAELTPALEEKRRRVKELGLWAPFLPEELGGLGMSLTEYARVSEELGWSMLGHYCFNCQAPDVGNMELLMHHGTPDQQARWLAPLASGEIRSCFSMTEPEHAGSNPVHLSTTAVRDGDDYVINGHKWFTSSAEGSAFAIVMAVTNPEAKRPHERASRIAESRAEIHASRLMVLDAAERIDREGAPAARVDISLIKFFVAGVLQRVIDRAIQTHGALGLTDDTPLASMARHERAARIYDGPDEVHKSVVAREILRGYGVSVAI